MKEIHTTHFEELLTLHKIMKEQINSGRIYTDEEMEKYAILDTLCSALNLSLIQTKEETARIEELEAQLDELKLRMEVALGSTKANNSWTKLIEAWVKTMGDKP